MKFPALVLFSLSAQLIQVSTQASEKIVAPDLSSRVEATTCRLIFRSTQNPTDVRSVCTGVLIAPDRVATARHCFKDKKLADVTMTVDCGSTGKDSGTSGKKLGNGWTFFDEGPAFREKSKATSVRMLEGAESAAGYKTGSDYAEVTLDPPMRTAPAPVSPIANYIDPESGNPLPGVQCKMEGYGLTAGSLYGLPRSTAIAPNGVSHGMPSVLSERRSDRNRDYSDCVADYEKMVSGEKRFGDWVETLYRSHLVPKSHMPGDSGGPLYCRSGAQAPWTLVAVIGWMDAAWEKLSTKDSDGFRIEHEITFTPLPGTRAKWNPSRLEFRKPKAVMPARESMPVRN